MAGLGPFMGPIAIMRVLGDAVRYWFGVVADGSLPIMSRPDGGALAQSTAADGSARRPVLVERSGLSEATASLLHLFDYLRRFEEKHATDAWLAGDVHVWPVIKHLCVSLVLRYASDPDGFDRTIAVADRQFAEGRRRARHFDVEAAAGLLRGNATDGPEFLFVGNRTAFKDLAGLGIQLNYDYLRVALEAQGQRTRSLMTGISEDDIRARPTLLPHDSIEAAAEHLRQNFSTGRALDSLSPMYDLTESLANLLGSRTPERLLSHFDLYISRVEDAAAAWEVALGSKRAKSCLCYNYTNPICWGLSVAARRLGIPCFEIQHGMQGRMHGAYHWAKVPPGGWTTVPNGRLVWSAAELETMYPACIPHVIGPGSLQTLAMVMDPRAATWSAALAGARERLVAEAEPMWRELMPDGRPRVLFMSQRKTDIDILARLVADKQRRYYFRFHPSHDKGSASPEIAALLSAVKADSSTNLPLPMMMAGTDLILCHSSAGFIEGRYFGLPTVFLDDYACTIRDSYGAADLVQSSVERCADDIGGLALQSNPASPIDRVMSMINDLPDPRQLAAELAA
jgi:hypothetical protein